MSIVLQFYPNGEFSQGVDTSSNRPPKHVCKTTQTYPSGKEITDYDLRLVQQQTAEMGAQIYSKVGTYFTGSGGQTFRLVESGDDYCVLTGFRNYTETGTERVDTSIYRLIHLGFLSPLVHQSVESCEKPESRKKLTSMSKRMSRNIRNGVYLLEQKPGGKDVLSFLTLTLPNLSTEGLKACCENWDSMVKRFFDWLRIKLKAAGLALEHVYCTEIQTKRLTNRGEYAPHLHVVFKGRISRRSSWIITPKQARKAWAKCIHAYTDEQFDTNALENLQRIKQSAARYLSKYISKGSNIIPTTEEGNPVCSLRTQWGGMARAISKGIRQATQKFVGRGTYGHVAWGIYNNIDRLLEGGFILYFKRGFIPLHSGSAESMDVGLHVGVGCLSTPTYKGGVAQILDFLYKSALL